MELVLEFRSAWNPEAMLLPTGWQCYPGSASSHLVSAVPLLRVASCPLTYKLISAHLPMLTSSPPLSADKTHILLSKPTHHSTLVLQPSEDYFHSSPFSWTFYSSPTTPSSPLAHKHARGSPLLSKSTNTTKQKLPLPSTKFSPVQSLPHRPPSHHPPPSSSCYPAPSSCHPAEGNPPSPSLYFQLPFTLQSTAIQLLQNLCCQTLWGVGTLYLAGPFAASENITSSFLGVSNHLVSMIMHFPDSAYSSPPFLLCLLYGFLFPTVLFCYLSFKCRCSQKYLLYTLHFFLFTLFQENLIHSPGFNCTSRLLSPK